MKLKKNWKRILTCFLVAYAIGLCFSVYTYHDRFAKTSSGVNALEVEVLNSTYNADHEKQAPKLLASERESKTSETDVASLAYETTPSDQLSSRYDFNPMRTFFTLELLEFDSLADFAEYLGISVEDVNALAKTLYGEANSVESVAERSMVIWTILNRYDQKLYSTDDTLAKVAKHPYQFTGYNPDHPITERNLNLVIDALWRWHLEGIGKENIGRTLPSDILFFSADSNPEAGEWHNKFYRYSKVNHGDKIYFDRSCPYEDPYIVVV